jgi:phosphoenolpyruvate carboxykinase (ATP)
MPVLCPFVPEEMLDSRNTWRRKLAYDLKAFALAGMFEKNFLEHAGVFPEAVKRAGPKRIGELREACLVA